MLKNYWQFISERNIFVDESNIISDEDMLTTFEYLTDNGYTIYINRFLKDDLIDYFKNGTEFDNNISSQKEYYYCYNITINPVKVNPLMEDITTDLKSAIEQVESLGLHLLDMNNPLPSEFEQDKLELEDYDYGIVHIDNIILDEGHIIEWMSDEPYESNKYDLVKDQAKDIEFGAYKLLDELILTFANLKKNRFTKKEIAKLLKWTDYEVDGDDIYIDIGLEELRDRLISSNCDYHDILVDGVDWDSYYDNSYYNNPETDALFQYYLTDENALLLVRKIILNFGGVDVVREETDDVDILDLLSDGDETDEDLVRFFIDGKNYTELEELDDELLDEVKRIIGDAYTGALASETEELVHNSFDKKLVEEEIIFHSAKKDDDGKWVYRFYYDDKWLEDINLDYEDLTEIKLHDIFIEFLDGYGAFYLHPRIPDYGSPDSKYYNDEIKNHLTD